MRIDPLKLDTPLAGSPPETGLEMEFYSSAGFVNCGPMSGISFQGSNPWTIEGWFFLDALIDTMMLVSRGSEFVLETRGGSVYANRLNQIQALTTPSLLQEHTWHHIAVSFDGATMLAYIDGVQQGSVTLSDAGAPSSGSSMVIGGTGSGTGFYGQIDSVRMWSMAVPGSQTGSGQPDVYSHQWVDYPANTPHLLAQIDLTQNPPVDTSGNKVPLTVSPKGTRYRSFVPAAHLQDNAFIDPYNDGAVNPAGSSADFSVMAWINPSAYGTTVFSNGTSPQGMSLGLTAAGKLQLQVGAATPLTGTAVLSPGTWSNVAATWSASTGTGTLYVNGNADGSPGTGISAGAAMSAGVPLVGGLAVTGTLLPTASFQGFIQEVMIWNRALSPTDVVTYQTADPMLDATCVADYELVPPRALNLVSLNPLGLVDGANVTVVEHVSGGSAQAAATVSAPAHARQGEPADAQPERADAPPLDAGAALFSEEERARWVEEFRLFMADELGLPGEHRDALAARMEANLSLAAERFAATGPPALEMVVGRRPDGTGTLHLVGPDGASTLVFEGTLDDCTVWAIGFIIQLGLVIWTVLGFYTNLDKVRAGITTYLGTKISPALLTELRTVFAAGPSPTTVYNGIKTLHEYGVLTPLFTGLKGAVTGSLSFWTMLTVVGRIILLVSPSAPLAIALFVAELALSLAGIITTWGVRPTGCWGKATQPAAQPA